MAKTNYINAELDWAEKKLQEWQEYIDANPIHKLLDRTELEETRGGSKLKVIATIETQGKYIQEMMKNYLSLLGEVNKMREVEEKKKEARGRATVPHRMK
jgi:uncharacterized protein YlxP (DUF503 family)